MLNPQRDIGSARHDYRISASDVLLAPTLADAWTLIAPTLVGFTPVGVLIDEKLGLIDYELKRLGQIRPMPHGVELPLSAFTLVDRHGLEAQTALERAQCVLHSRERVGYEEPGATAFTGPEISEECSGYLLSRDRQTLAPDLKHTPALSALVDVCQSVSPLLIGHPDPDGVGAKRAHRLDGPWVDAARRSVAVQLEAAALRVGVTEEIVERLRDAEQLLGVTIVDAAMSSKSVVAQIDSVLVAGARVCFTGVARDGAGRLLSRGEMMAIARVAGLIPVDSVTKAKCEALVVAELGSLSGKARRARELGKPVYSAEEFLTWAAS